ncbi:MAG: CsbD family protein [Gemmatimonadales bacterium]|nr:CsbD family protein [Gemmatimonadales bacterium]
MNHDTMEGNWKQMKGKVQEKWGKLTNDDLDVIDGKRENLAGKLQERYGLAKDDVDRELDDFYQGHEADRANR